VPSRPEASATRKRRVVASIAAAVGGLGLIGLAIYETSFRGPRETMSKVTIGANDTVYFTHSATEQDARALGRALQLSGFFHNGQTSVMLSKGTAGTVISYVVNNNAWTHADTILGFEEITRRAAQSIGGYPVEVRLCDIKWNLQKELWVGRVAIGVKDEVYYYGSATPAQADALGRALQNAKYFVDSGSTVVLAKDATSSISFVLSNNAWNLPGAVFGFETLVRQVAPAVGGLPVDLRLLNSQMGIEKELDGIK
jgi:hypothetical protein